MSNACASDQGFVSQVCTRQAYMRRPIIFIRSTSICLMDGKDSFNATDRHDHSIFCLCFETNCCELCPSQTGRFGRFQFNMFPRLVVDKCPAIGFVARFLCLFLVFEIVHRVIRFVQVDLCIVRFCFKAKVFRPFLLVNVWFSNFVRLYRTNRRERNNAKSSKWVIKLFDAVIACVTVTLVACAALFFVRDIGTITHAVSVLAQFLLMLAWGETTVRVFKCEWSNR